MQARRQAAAEKGDPHNGSAAKKGKRAAVFAQWLVDTYGTAFLNSGTGESSNHCCHTHHTRTAHVHPDSSSAAKKNGRAAVIAQWLGVTHG